MGKGDSFHSNMPHRAFQCAVYNHQCFQSRNDHFGSLHIFFRAGIIVDCPRRIFLKPLSGLVQQFQSIRQAKGRVAFLSPDDGLRPRMGKLQMTLRFVKANDGLFSPNVYTLHTQNGNRPTLMNYHFQSTGIEEVSDLRSRDYYRLFFRIEINHPFHHSIRKLCRPLGLVTIYPHLAGFYDSISKGWRLCHPYF